MFFRERGNRIQVVRSGYDQATKKRTQKIVFSFSVAIENMDGFDPLDLNKLTVLEREELRLYFAKDEKMVHDLVEDIHTMATCMQKKSFSERIKLNRLRAAISILQNTMKDLNNE